MMSFGGHNVLEPAALGVPVVVGPYTYNFTEIVTILHSVGALAIAKNEMELGEYLARWLNNSEERDKAGAAGRQIVAQNRGAAAKVMGIVDRMMATLTPTNASNSAKVDELPQ